MARISVMEVTQQIADKPNHFTTRKIAQAIVSDKQAEWCGKRRIKLLTSKSWASIRLSYKEISVCRGKKVTEIVLPQLTKEDPYENRRCMMLQYPPTDQTSYSKANFNRIWGSNLRNQDDCQI